MLFFDGIDLLVHAIFGVFHFAGNILARIVSLLFLALVGRILYVAPGFFGGTLHLVCHAAIREIVVADGFADALFHFACNLIDFSCDLILIDGGYSFFTTLFLLFRLSTPCG